MKPDTEKGIKCYAYANFAGGHNQEEDKDPGLILSRKGYMITYYNCQIIWEIRLQKDIALSTTEAEYIAIFQAMRDI